VDVRSGDGRGRGYPAAVLVPDLPLAGGCQHLALVLADELTGDIGMSEHGISFLSG
jgi:hypothetical protein